MPLEPERVTYTEVYRTECPHGCAAQARVTMIREKRGPVLSVKIECMSLKANAEASTAKVQ